MILLQLFWEFFKTGLFAVGGGLATLPFLSRMADSTGWFTQGQLADMLAVSESTPGAIGINMATYVGFVTAGIPGAIVATLGLVIPSILIILLIAMFLRNFQDNRIVKSTFTCLRPASTGLIAAAGLSVAVLALFNAGAGDAGIIVAVNWKAVVLAGALFIVTRVIKRTGKLHPIVWIAVSAAAGAVFKFAGA